MNVNIAATRLRVMDMMMLIFIRMLSLTWPVSNVGKKHQKTIDLWQQNIQKKRLYKKSKIPKEGDEKIVSSNYVHTYEDGNCTKCGKPYYYVGDIPEGGFPRGSEPYCTCYTGTSASGTTGWICPVCGAGLSPYTAVCPCKFPGPQITWRTE